MALSSQRATAVMKSDTMDRYAALVQGAAGSQGASAGGID